MKVISNILEDREGIILAAMKIIDTLLIGPGACNNSAKFNIHFECLEDLSCLLASSLPSVLLRLIQKHISFQNSETYKAIGSSIHLSTLVPIEVKIHSESWEFRQALVSVFRRYQIGLGRSAPDLRKLSQKERACQTDGTI